MEVSEFNLFDLAEGLTDLEIVIIQNDMEKAYRYYIANFYGKDWTLACSIHDLFVDDLVESHNCIACNLESTSTLIAGYLANYKNFKSPEYFYPILLLNLYLMIERIEHFCKIMHIKDLNENDEQHFPNFQNIRKWANFIKHPKSFMFSHHATHLYMGLEKSTELESSLIIDDGFVKNYYSGGKKNLELKEKINSSKEGVTVLYPNPKGLIKGFCSDFQNFILLLKNNPEYRELLDEQTTIYYEEMDDLD